MTHIAAPQQEGERPAPEIAARLLDWYDRHRRHMPWRAQPGGRPDPYRVWLSEIMLQQTTVATVGPYFEEFVRRWPTVRALAEADLDSVLHAWQGLGYYARARNLHRCAQIVGLQRGGVFPADEADLRELPGIGPYTAAAIAAIAFDAPATVVDGNVERVMARLHAIAEPLPGSKPRIRAAAVTLTPSIRPGDYAQAVMDLGATICTPRKPDCGGCPVSDLCEGRRTGVHADLPRKIPGTKRPLRHGVAFWSVDDSGQVMLRRRPEKGLLGGLMEVPGTPWRDAPWSDAEAVAAAPFQAPWRRLPGTVAHGFTHFRLELSVMAAPGQGGGEGLWWPVDRLGEQALPTLMKKVVRHVRKEN